MIKLYFCLTLIYAYGIWCIPAILLVFATNQDSGRWTVLAGSRHVFQVDLLCCSVAILKYLAQKYSSTVADHWYPADLKQQARVNEYLAWQHTNLRSNGSKVFLFRVRVTALSWHNPLQYKHNHFCCHETYLMKNDLFFLHLCFAGSVLILSR